MNPILLATLIATALLAPAPANASDEPVVALERRHLAAAGDLVQHDAWKRWAEDFSREMRASMGTMFGPRLGGGKVVKGAPYSAEVITEANQALADGNIITRRKQGAAYRDGEGRTRQEMPGDGKEPTVFINDPVEGRHFVLSPGTKHPISMTHKDKQVVRLGKKEVRVEDGRVFVDGKQATAGTVQVVSNGRTIVVENGKVMIDGKLIGASDGSGTTIVKSIDANESGDGTRREEIRVQVVRAGDDHLIPIPPVPPMPPGALSAPLAPLPPFPPMPGVQTFRFESTGKLGKGVATSLGTKDFDGVRAEGKSTVWTIAAGAIGNRNPIEVTSETWYAPELQLDVYTRYNDPRTGESIYRLAGIRRGEPAPELFRAPAGDEAKRRGASEIRRER